MALAVGLAVGGAGWAGQGGLAEKPQPRLVSANHFNEPVKPQLDQTDVKQQRKDSRGDTLPDGAVLRFGSARLRHGGTIYGSALSPDGKILATAGRHSVIVWNLETGRRLHDFGCDHTSSFSNPGLIFSPDGTRLGYVRSYFFACVWDVQTGKEMRRFERKYQDGLKKFWQSSGGFINQGKEFVLCSHEAIHTWNLESGHETSSVPAMVRGLSPDARTSWRDDDKGGVVLSDARTGKEMSRIADVRHPSGSNGLKFSSDSKALAVTVSNFKGEREIQVRETSTGKVKTSFVLPESVQMKSNNTTYREYRVTFAPDGKTLLLGTWGGLIHRWDVATGEQSSTLTKHHCPVVGMHPLPDGRTLVSTGQGGVIRRWNLQTGRHDAEPESYEGKSQATFSSDGQFVAIGDAGGRVDLWDAHSGKIIRTLQHEGTSVDHMAFAPDGKLLAGAERSGTVRFWQVPSGKPGDVWQREPTRGEWFCHGLRFSPDGRLLCISDYPKQFRVVEAASGKLLWTGASSGGEAFFPDGDTLLAATPAGAHLTTFAAKTGRFMSTLRLNSKTPDNVGHWYKFAFSADGRHLALAFGGSLLLCDGHTCTEKQRLADHD